MKLLITAQSVNDKDPVMSFFVGWLREFSKKFESITVICLEKGSFNLPDNVKVLSLGKESGRSRIKYLARLYSYIISERKNYGAVFVHMNKEYAALAGWIWRLMGKRVYLWSNHPKGNIITDFASIFCNKVFCTSKFSYTAKYKKTVFMPVGIDTDIFHRDQEMRRAPRSILFLSRIAGIKRPDLLIEALKELKKRSVAFQASFVGSALPIDEAFRQQLIDDVELSGLSGAIKFYGGVPNSKTVEIYNQHEIFVNLSPNGMYDKTIFEAMACEEMVITSNANLIGKIDARFVLKGLNKDELVEKLKVLLDMNEQEQKAQAGILRKFVVENHSLASLGAKLLSELNSDR